MTIDQIQLANTFDVWRIRTNQLITISNDLKEGNLLSTGTVSISNPTGFQNNVSLNVRSGMIYGDGGLLSNVGKPSSITNDKLQNNNINITATQDQIVLSNGTIELGSTVYLNVANLVTVNTDTSTSNIASANLVNAVHTIATRADVVSVAAFNKSNSANLMAYNASQLANAVNITVSSATTTISGLGSVVVYLNANTVAAFNKANAANIIASQAFDKANAANVLAFNTGIGANAFAAATIAGANARFFATIAGANTAVGAGANNFLLAVIDGANTAVGDGANNFLLATLDGANVASQAAYNKANAYVMTHYVLGSPATSASIYYNASPFSYVLPSSLTGSYVVANNRPLVGIALTMLKNGANIGTINFTGGSSGVQETATFTFSTQQSFAAGDVLGIRNTTLAAQTQFQNIMFTIVGTRT